MLQTEFSFLTLMIKDEDGRYRVATGDEILAAAQSEINKRFSRGAILTTPDATKEALRLKLAHYEHEVFAVLWLDNRHGVIAFEELFRGTIDGASVYPREVVKGALDHNAAACIFAHNHPSGVCEPSQADMRITERLKDALALVDVRVLDRMVVADEICSFAERGLISEPGREETDGYHADKGKVSMAIPPLKISTDGGASKAERERRTFVPEDEAILKARWDHVRIGHDAWTEEQTISRFLAHGERRGRTRAQQAAFQIRHAIETGQDQVIDKYRLRSISVKYRRMSTQAARQETRESETPAEDPVWTVPRIETSKRTRRNLDEALQRPTRKSLDKNDGINAILLFIFDNDFSFVTWHSACNTYCKRRKRRSRQPNHSL